MKYENIKNLDNEKFRRLSDVKRTTFNKMLIIIKDANQKKKAKGGRKNKLHDFRMYKESNRHIHAAINILTD